MKDRPIKDCLLLGDLISQNIANWKDFVIGMFAVTVFNKSHSNNLRPLIRS